MDKIPTTQTKPRCPIAVFASGNGSNFQALIDACAQGTLDAEIRVLLCDNPKAYALQRAQDANIPTALLQSSGNRHTDGQHIVSALAPYQVSLICLAGFMRILDPVVIQAYQHRILNIHPSLLPKFPGLHAVRQALDAGAAETGCTVHFVDEGVDTGPVVAQATVSISADDNEHSLHNRIHTLEHQLYPQAVQRVIHDHKLTSI